MILRYCCSGRFTIKIQDSFFVSNDAGDSFVFWSAIFFSWIPSHKGDNNIYFLERM